MHDSNAEWLIEPLQNVFSRVVQGGTPSTSIAAYWDGDIPWITGADFTSRGIGDIRRHVSKEGIQSSSTSVVESGDLLVVTRTGVGKLAIANRPIAISQDITGVCLDSKRTDVGFFYFLLSVELENLKKLNQGTSINGITRRDLERHVVRFPKDVTVQQKIARILQTIDRAIEKTEALIDKYQQIKAGLMHDLFTRGIAPDGQLRPSREQAPELYQETPIGWVPKEWSVWSIGSLFNRTATKGRPGLPITSVVMGQGLVPREQVGRRVESNLSPEQHLLVKKGDIAYNMMRMWQGVLGLAKRDCLVSPAYVVIEPTDKVLPEFAELLLSRPESINEFHRLSYGVVNDRLRLYVADFMKVKIAIPDDKEEQRRITNRISEVRRYIDLLHTEVEKIEGQKSGLMHDLLTGKVPVQVDPQDEPEAAHV